jgi:hypothetical protein
MALPALGVALCLALLTIHCGKLGSPAVPKPLLPGEVTELTAEVGCNVVQLSFVPPVTYENGRPLEAIDSFVILRRISPPKLPTPTKTPTPKETPSPTLTPGSPSGEITETHGEPGSLTPSPSPTLSPSVSPTPSPSPSPTLPAGWEAPEEPPTPTPRRTPQPAPTARTDWEVVAYLAPRAGQEGESEMPGAYTFEDTGRRFMSGKGKDLIELRPPQDEAGLPRFDSFLLPGHTYQYQVLTEDRRGRRSSKSTTARVVYLVPPAQPTGLQGRSVEGAILLTWEPVETLCTGALTTQTMDYVVFKVLARKDGADREGVNIGTTVDPLFKDRAVEDNTRYGYYVRARLREAKLEGVSSEPVEVTYVDHFPPAPPENINFVLEARQVRFFWNTGEAADIRGVLVQRSVAEGEWESLTPEPLPGNRFTDNDLLPRTVYRYRFCAVDSSLQENQSPWSLPVTVILEE